MKLKIIILKNTMKKIIRNHFKNNPLEILFKDQINYEDTKLLYNEFDSMLYSNNSSNNEFVKRKDKKKIYIIPVSTNISIIPEIKTIFSKPNIYKKNKSSSYKVHNNIFQKKTPLYLQRNTENQNSSENEHNPEYTNKVLIVPENNLKTITKVEQNDSQNLKKILSSSYFYTYISLSANKKTKIIILKNAFQKIFNVSINQNGENCALHVEIC